MHAEPSSSLYVDASLLSSQVLRKQAQIPPFWQLVFSTMKLLYPNSLVFDPTLLEGFGVSLHQYDAHKPVPEDLIDAEILVTWANTNLPDAAKRMHNLRWIQSLFAGPNDVLAAGFPSNIIVTAGTNLHDETVVEHALALILSAARKLYEMRDYQNQKKWPAHLGGFLPDRPKGSFTSLKGANVLIWGVGNIGRKLAPHLVALGANVRGVGLFEEIIDGIQVQTNAALPEILPQTDAVIMILPGSKATFHALNSERLKLLPKHAWVINVGRGVCVDENALARALKKHRIGGAALDVFHTEPLPTSSPLWDAPNLIISPHAAGGRPRYSEALVAENLRRFLAGQPLKHDVSAGGMYGNSSPAAEKKPVVKASL
jgi:phosphoglycerate dehydrogenase-like enzyme